MQANCPIQDIMKNVKKPTIYAYGFDKRGFPLPGTPVEEAGFILRFIGYEAECSLEEADGLVIPSGIFEKIYWPKDFYGPSEQQIQYDVDLLAVREKQLFNAFKRGVWTAFLLQEVNNGKFNDWTDTDLAKKFLNSIATNVRHHEPNAYVTCKADEFRKYLDQFGIAQTCFWPKDSNGSVRTLAEENSTPVALETM
jgi:hypothetical protein